MDFSQYESYGFVKKTQKTPRAQIELAKKYRADFLRRYPVENKRKREAGE